MPSWVNDETSNGQPSKQRKRWEIEDKKSLRNLKFQLAEDGAPEVQYDLGKQLLDDMEDTERNIQGIQYLKRAAEQGHEHALELLGACFRTRRGITSANENEISKFLGMSSGERSSRRAAQELFASLSNGAEYVTVEQLERRMREIYKLQKRKKRSDEPAAGDEVSIQDKDENEASGSSSSTQYNANIPRSRDMDENNHISEANLLSAAYNYSNGQIPAVNEALTLSIPHPQSLDHVPCLHRPFFHPATFFALLYHRFISIFSSFPTSSIAKFQIVIAMAVYAIISTENLLVFLPLAGYFITLAVMLISSFKMLRTKHEFIDFRMWSGLFLTYGDVHVNAENSENQYLKNNMKPYFYFFVSFGMNLMIHPLISEQWLPHSEITVISFLLTFLTLFAFMYTSSSTQPDFLVLFSFGLNVLAKYPYEFDSVVTNSWRFLDLKIPGFSTFVIGSGIEFCLNCRGVLYLAIPVFLVFLARRRNWHGIFQFLFPHCVTLSWLQVCIISSQSATMFGLMRSALGVAGVLFFLPLFGLVTLLIPVFAAVEWLSLTDSTNRIFATIATSIIAIFGSCFMAISNRAGKYVTIFQILLCILATCFLFYPYMSNDQTIYSSYLQQTDDSQTKAETTKERILEDNMEDSDVLNWELYHKYCLIPQNNNRIKTQLRCLHLDRSNIYWDGFISDVAIIDVSNWRSDAITNYLPEWISNQILCYFGELNDANCFPNENCDDVKDYIDGQKLCNVDKWNTYKYQIETMMISPAGKGLLSLNNRQDKVILRADHTFGNFTQRINSSDKIWFKGTLHTKISKVDEVRGVHKAHKEDSSKLSRLHPVIKLTAMGCLQCADKDLTSISIKKDLKMNSRLKDLRRGCKYLLNTLFSPLVTFK